MDHATATHVAGVIVSFSYKFRMSAMVTRNAGPKDTLESNPVWEGLKRSGIEGCFSETPIPELRSQVSTKSGRHL